MHGDLYYQRPASLKEALQFLNEHGENATVVAGGTDVMVNMRSEELKPKYLLDVSRLPELKGIEMKGDDIWVGAGVTISEIYDSDVLERFAPALQKASFRVASRPIRNVATIGGNMANCSPCADTLPPLLIYESKVVLRSLEDERTVPIQDVPTGPYESSINPDEMIIRFILEPKEGGFSDFQKIGRRQELAIARVSMAVTAEKDTEDKITFMRLALGSCTFL